MIFHARARTKVQYRKVSSCLYMSLQWVSHTHRSCVCALLLTEPAERNEKWGPFLIPVVQLLFHQQPYSCSFFPTRKEHEDPKKAHGVSQIIPDPSLQMKNYHLDSCSVLMISRDLCSAFFRCLLGEHKFAMHLVWDMFQHPFQEFGRCLFPVVWSGTGRTVESQTSGPSGQFSNVGATCWQNQPPSAPDGLQDSQGGSPNGPSWHTELNAWLIDHPDHSLV